MDYTLTNILNDEMPTKQRIMICALHIFSTKGYSETTIRDIATDVGITSGSIYGHFASKEEILSAMLNDYAEYTKGLFDHVDIEPILKEKPTGEGISLCFMLGMSKLTEDVYYGNLVHLIHQEQHRNPLFARFVLVRLQDTTDFVVRIFKILKEMKVVRPDVNVEYLGAITYSVLHTITSCTAINVMLKSPGYAVKDIVPILRYFFDTILTAYKLPSEES